MRYGRISPNPPPTPKVNNSLESEYGPRWYELVSVAPSSETGYDVYVLKTMRRMRTRFFHVDGTQSVSNPITGEVQGAHRVVEITGQSKRFTLKDGSELITNVLITRDNGVQKFTGQMTIDGTTISLSGYHG